MLTPLILYIGNFRVLFYVHGWHSLTDFFVSKVKSNDSGLFFIKCFDDTIHGFRVPKNSLQQSREVILWILLSFIKLKEHLETKNIRQAYYCRLKSYSLYLLNGGNTMDLSKFGL